MTFCCCGFRFSLGLPVALPLRDPLPPLSLLDRSESIVIFALILVVVKAVKGIHRSLAARRAD